MRILISNDDGIEADGIHALVEQVHTFGELVVVAPDRQRSASSHGISIHQRLYVKEFNFGYDHVKAYSISGTPVDCVKWACVELTKQAPFDFMLSGINEGSNLATDVLYSGTVAAAGEAAMQQIPALALSLVGPPFEFAPAARAARELLCLFKDKTFPPDTFLNINFPVQNADSATYSATILGARGYKNFFIKKMDAEGKVYYRHTGEELEEISGEGTDVYAIRDGRISITPLRYHFTNDTFLDSLNSWLKTT